MEQMDAQLAYLGENGSARVLYTYYLLSLMPFFSFPLAPVQAKKQAVESIDPEKLTALMSLVRGCVYAIHTYIQLAANACPSCPTQHNLFYPISSLALLSLKEFCHLVPY